MKARFLLIAWLAAAAPPPALAQTDASLGVGAGTVRYTGGASFSSLSVAPAFQSMAPALSVGTSAVLSSLPNGEWAAQARGDAWAPLLAETRTLRPALAGTLAGSTRSDGVRSGAVHALAEAVWTGPGGGWGAALGAGPSLGSIDGEVPVTALRLRVRAWARRTTVQVALAAEPTRFFGAWYTDVTASAALERGRVSAQAWAIARLSDVYGSKATASAAVQLRLTPVISIEAAAGGYLSEPFQGFPRAGFASAAVRLHVAPRPATPPPVALSALEPARRGDSLVVRFRMPGARSVAIAGDWIGWQPLPLVPVGDEVWEAVLTLPPGTYYFNLLVDGQEWVVPGGVATLPDGLGGLLAILTVP